MTPRYKYLVTAEIEKQRKQLSVELLGTWSEYFETDKKQAYRHTDIFGRLKV